MTKNDLVANLLEAMPQLTKKDATLIVNTIFETMTEALKRGERIEIRGFGIFSVVAREPRIGRNPKSGERVEIPAKRVPFFKTGKELRQRVDYPRNAS
ncbi:MAG: integration host factor subunit beta [Deltaproteobacteria bacterium]|nr:MAG: integration host factor subunit beta [Deltaproteobacteria bacterium]